MKRKLCKILLILMQFFNPSQINFPWSRNKLVEFNLNFSRKVNPTQRGAVEMEISPLNWVKWKIRKLIVELRNRRREKRSANGIELIPTIKLHKTHLYWSNVLRKSAEVRENILIWMWKDFLEKLGNPAEIAQSNGNWLNTIYHGYVEKRASRISLPFASSRASSRCLFVFLCDNEKSSRPASQPKQCWRFSRSC